MQQRSNTLLTLQHLFVVVRVCVYACLCACVSGESGWLAILLQVNAVSEVLLCDANSKHSQPQITTNATSVSQLMVPMSQLRGSGGGDDDDDVEMP